MTEQEDHIKRIQEITFEAYKSSGRIAALLDQSLVPSVELSKELEKTACQMEQGTIELRTLCARYWYPTQPIGNKPVLETLEIAGRAECNEFGWLHIQLNALLPNCRFASPIWITDSSEPCQIARHILVNHYGTLLTTDPIQLPADGYLNFSGEELVFSEAPPITADDFQNCHPSSGQDVLELYPMREEERDLFFSSLDTEDPSLGCIGHVRGDFDRGSGVLYTTWWPHVCNDPLNTPEFAAHLEKTIHWLRTGFAPLKNLEIMDAFCSRYEHARIPGQTERCYGFRVESTRYRYMLRCTPLQGWYHLYLYCYSKEHMKQSPSECKEVNVHGA